MLKVRLMGIKNIGLLMFGERPDKLIAGSKIELVRFHDKEAEASDFTEKTFYGPIWKQVRDALEEATCKCGFIQKLQKGCASRDSNLFRPDSNYQFSWTGSLY